MKLLPRLALPVVAAGLLLAGLASAQAIDPPAVSIVQSGKNAIELMVTSNYDGAPGGFTVQWIPATLYNSLGGWPADGDPSINSASFTGAPTFHTTPGISDFILPPDMGATVFVGDLFDETGVSGTTSELPEGTQWVIRVRCDQAYGYSASVWTQPSNTSTATRNSDDCTFTQGFWKNHPNNWPVASLTLGTVSYTKTQLLSILNQPAGGNGLLILAHQLIAAKLNIANGASVPAGVATAISNADAMIGNLVCPPVGSGFLSPSSVNSDANTLDDYNNGITGPGHCGSVPTKTSTWGQLKARYR
ncbi:MAG TPA: hypothetical protein VGU27_07870 [Candidatus Eisenbacteria bacterium]|nr:hypothetical protein [Candidatus Eisenbacteria bacterium]